MNIVLFSRPVRSGKTTELAAWCAGRSDVGGILMPDRDGVRYFVDIESGTQWPAVAMKEEEALPVGRFLFSAAAFRKACKCAALSAGKRWTVIDEIGKLELAGEGFGPLLRNLAAQPPGAPEYLLLVVRDTLLEAVRREFGLEGARVVSALDGL
ncbi:MAG: hypothetical protein EOO16_26995 [Chitinophagaceae bacterium]|nr:MAG: hypothetical protein EOO16_26995 [Chitinophagaceae bacterium]